MKTLLSSQTWQVPEKDSSWISSDSVALSYTIKAVYTPDIIVEPDIWIIPMNLSRIPSPVPLKTTTVINIE